MYVCIPEHNITMALNTNALDYGMMPIMFNAIAVVMGEGVIIPSFNTIDLSLSAAELNQYVGVYKSDELPFNLVFQTDGEVLQGAPEGSDLKPLKATKKDEFILESFGVTLNFNLEAKTVLFNQPGESPKTLTKVN